MQISKIKIIIQNLKFLILCLVLLSIFCFLNLGIVYAAECILNQANQHSVLSLEPFDYFNFSIPSSAGQTFCDPVFGTEIKRITDTGPTASNKIGGDISGLNEANQFSYDGSYFLATKNSSLGENYVFDGKTGLPYKKLATVQNVKIIPYDSRWPIQDKYKGDDGQYHYFDRRYNFYYIPADKNEIWLYNWQTETRQIIHVFSEYAEIDYVGGDGTDLSNDGQWLLVAGAFNQGDLERSEAVKEIFAFDVVKNTKGKVATNKNPPDSGKVFIDFKDLGQGSNKRIDYGTMSASGDYIVLLWGHGASDLTTRYSGIELYKRDWTYIRMLHPNPEHVDPGYNLLGQEVLYVGSPNDINHPFYDLPGASAIARFGDYISIRIYDRSLGQEASDHVRLLAKRNEFSYTGINFVSPAERPGYIYLSLADVMPSRIFCPSNQCRTECTFRISNACVWPLYAGEIMAIPTDGSAASDPSKVIRLAHHRSIQINPPGISGHTAPETYFLVDRKGEKIAFKSNMNQSDKSIDLYFFDTSGSLNGLPPPIKTGDLNNDNKVDVIDLGILLSNWGNPPAGGTRPPADLNQDGKVDVVDLGILLSNWG